MNKEMIASLEGELKLRKSFEFAADLSEIIVVDVV
jgi:hypothetical protein